MLVFSLLRTMTLGVLIASIGGAPKEAPTDERDGTARLQLRAPTPATNSSDNPETLLMLLDDQSRHLSFQALLTNEMGNPINMPNGQHELDFRLYAMQGGFVAEIGSVLDVVVTLNNGVASTQIGPMDPDWFDGSARWLGVTVDNGQELTPRIPLGAVPYAFRVDRVASEELDDAIELGDPATSGSLQIYSNELGTVTVDADGDAGRVSILNPNGPGGIILHGQGQVIETRDNTGTPVALYGFDGVSAGAACLLATASGSIGAVIDGHANGGDGGLLQLFDNATDLGISLTASDATIRAGSTGGGSSGQMHLFPAAGGASAIHLNAQTADLRLGFPGVGSGDLRTFASSGGIQTIHLDGNNGHVVLTDGVIETIRLDGNGGGGGGGALMWNSAGVQTVEIDADEAEHGALRLSDGAGINTIELEARENAGSTGGQIVIRDSSGTAAIVLDAEVGAGGTGKITANGAIGVGTTNPNHELVVQGNDPVMQIRDDTTDNSANAARLELLENAGGSFDGGAFLWWNGETNKLLMGTKSNGTNTNVLVIDRGTSSVGIGTQNPGNFRLAVNGAIRAKEIVVDSGWSDFVFEPDYKLASLEQVEAHIAEHGHLPEIPSAAEVAEHGVRVGEMESKLLQKVEELTLHMISMDKRLKSLEQENQELRLRAGQPTRTKTGGKS